MLKKLLQLVVESDTQSTQALASQLGVTQTLVEDMLGSLALQGYLRDAYGKGGGNCTSGSCAMRSSCQSSGDNPKVWEVTDKGRKLLGITENSTDETPIHRMERR